MAAGSERMCCVLNALRSAASMSFCRCVACLLQWNRKCGTSSIRFGQCTQLGESDFFIW